MNLNQRQGRVSRWTTWAVYMCSTHALALCMFSIVHTSQSHTNDLYHLLMEEAVKEKYAVPMVTDNGPDYSMNSMLNMLYFQRLWGDLDLDLYVQTSFAPDHSTKNMAEYVWSPSSRFLAEAILPIISLAKTSLLAN